MEADERHHAEQGRARDQEQLLLLARLSSTGPVESLITQLVRDSMGTSVALTPGIEYALSASADAAAAAGQGARAWQARQAAGSTSGRATPTCPTRTRPIGSPKPWPICAMSASGPGWRGAPPMTRAMTNCSPPYVPSCAIPPSRPSRSARRPCAPSTPPCSAPAAARPASTAAASSSSICVPRPRPP